MRDLALAFKAAGDPTRLRILKLLERGGLCVCQVQAVLGLAPSTVSKHLTILKRAGLVDDQRDGKWIEYSLATTSRTPHVRPLLDLLRATPSEDTVLSADRRRLREVTRVPKTDLQRLAAPTRRAAVRGGR